MTMKKLIAAGLALTLTLSGSALLTSCAQDGKSAYEIALANGFEGSEADWLLSLKGENGKDGTDGENGKDGEDGKDSISPVNGTPTDFFEGSYQNALLASVSVYCNFMEVASNNWWSSPINRYESPSTSAGSGVIYRLDKEKGDAYLITNYHVVYNAKCNTQNHISDDISVYLYGMEGQEYAIPATYVGGSMNYDIAILKVSGSELLKQSSAQAVTVASPDEITVGKGVVAIGNPEAKGISMTRGIVSVDSESLSMTASDGQTKVTYRAIRVDTAVNSGNSGGGLFDLSGRLLGIVNAKVVDEGIEGIAYAIPIGIVTGAADSIIDHSSEKGYTDGVYKYLLGISVESTNARTELDEVSGAVRIREDVLVGSVSKGSLCDGVLQAGDRIVSLRIGDILYDVSRTYVIVDAMLNARVGDTVIVTVMRDGKTEEASFTITAESVSIYN